MSTVQEETKALSGTTTHGLKRRADNTRNMRLGGRNRWRQER
jgi:hypothetical protein